MAPYFTWRKCQFKQVPTWSSSLSTPPRHPPPQTPSSTPTVLHLPPPLVSLCYWIITSQGFCTGNLSYWNILALESHMGNPFTYIKYMSNFTFSMEPTHMASLQLLSNTGPLNPFTLIYSFFPQDLLPSDIVFIVLFVPPSSIIWTS